MADEAKKISHEIDFLKLGLTILKHWKSLALFLLVSAVLGCIVALNTPKTYTAEVILAPEMNSGGMGLSGNLADMAANFGIDLDTKSALDAIYPELYPDILSSPDFLLKLFDVPVRLKTDDKIRTYKYHLTKDGKQPFWVYPKAWLINMFKKKEVAVKGGKGKGSSLVISKDDAELCESIGGLISCMVDKKTSVISISVIDQDPMVAAIMADTLQHRLQEYITNYRTRKARTDYNYYKGLTADSKAKYLKAQKEYADFCDANVDADLQVIESKRDELENEMQLRYNTYSQMQVQAQQAQAKIRENTPAFTIIQNARMPYMPSSRPRVFTVLIFMFMGLVCDAVWILWRQSKEKTKRLAEKENKE